MNSRHFLRLRIVVAGGISRILSIPDADDPFGIFQPGRSQSATDRRQTEDEDMDRLPTYLGGFLDRLRCKFRYRDVIQEIRTGGLEVDRLRTDGRVGDLVWPSLCCRVGLAAKVQAKPLQPPACTLLAPLRRSRN